MRLVPPSLLLSERLLPVRRDECVCVCVFVCQMSLSHHWNLLTILSDTHRVWQFSVMSSDQYEAVFTHTITL